MASDMLDHLQRLAGLDIDQRKLHLFGDVEPKFIDKVAGMSEIFGLGDLFLARIPEILPNLGLQFRVLVPGLQRLGVASERGDAGAHIILVATLVHQRELARNDGHCRLLRDGVAVIGDTATSGMIGVFVKVFAQLIPRDIQKSHLRAWPKRLTNAAPHVKIMVIGNVFLVVGPNLLFAFNNHLVFKDLKFKI